MIGCWRREVTVEITVTQNLIYWFISCFVRKATAGLLVQATLNQSSITRDA